MSGFNSIMPAVFETSADPVLMADTDIAALIAAARTAPDRRARILLHGDRDDSLHEMVITLPPDSCDHPHINFKSGKSFLALSGRFAVMRFSDDGRTIEPFVLSAEPRWPGTRMVRLRAPAWHTIIPLEGDTVFLETIIGPFEGNRFADWFPGNDQPQARADWTSKLRTAARHAATIIL
jgi:cupin fold WbuC family metalloprotein